MNASLLVSRNSGESETFVLKIPVECQDLVDGVLADNQEAHLVNERRTSTGTMSAKRRLVSSLVDPNRRKGREYCVR